MYDFIKKTGIYYNALEHNNMIYSIDMIRLKTYITYDKYSNLDFYFRAYYKDKIKQYWISNRIKDFKYNWKIEVGEGRSFYFGFFHNTEEKFAERFEPEYNLTIEFNPNKLRDDKLVKHILGLSGTWYLRKYDLAIDIKVNILDIIFDKSGKRKFKLDSKGMDNRTIYLGCEGDKFIKIYNKKNESNLNITGSLTRVEITRAVDDFKISDIVLWHYDNYFPELYLNNYVYSLSDYEVKTKDKTLYAILYAVQNGYSINDLTRDYKRKIKNLLEGGYKIRFDDKTANQVLRKTIFSYFLNNSLMIFR